MFVFLYNIFNILGLLSSFTNLLIISVTPIKKVYQDIDTNVFKSSDQSGKKLISIVLILVYHSNVWYFYLLIVPGALKKFFLIKQVYLL